MLEAARNLIWKQGYCSVTIDAICVEAGVQKGSFYYFFDSKSDLAAAAFRELWESVKPQLDDIFFPSVPPLDRLRNYFNYVHENQAELEQKYGHVVGCPFGSVASELSQRDELVCQNARAFLNAYRKYFESALRDAQAEGSIELRSASTAAQRLAAYMEGTLLQARVQNDLSVLRDLATGAMEFIGAQDSAHPQIRRGNFSRTLRVAAGARL